MGESLNRVEVYLEVGEKRVFAGAVDWPGWCQSGRDESSALRAMLDSGPRYAQVLKSRQVPFAAPVDASSFVVVERLAGNSTTDFGAPCMPPSADSQPVDPTELRRLYSVLEACWLAFDSAADAAVGKELRKGPRGGGRDLDSITQHVLGGHIAYLSRLGWSYGSNDKRDLSLAIVEVRQETLKGLEAAAEGKIPPVGPRAGARWSPRYFVRRAAWHVLDHAWEIEDRIQSM